MLKPIGPIAARIVETVWLRKLSHLCLELGYEPEAELLEDIAQDRDRDEADMARADAIERSLIDRGVDTGRA